MPIHYCGWVKHAPTLERSPTQSPLPPARRIALPPFHPLALLAPLALFPRDLNIFHANPRENPHFAPLNHLSIFPASTNAKLPVKLRRNPILVAPLPPSPSPSTTYAPNLHPLHVASLPVASASRRCSPARFDYPQKPGNVATLPPRIPARHHSVPPNPHKFAPTPLPMCGQKGPPSPTPRPSTTFRRRVTPPRFPSSSERGSAGGCPLHFHPRKPQVPPCSGCTCCT